jgi:DNA-binding NarL/FixJ family response regulator
MPGGGITRFSTRLPLDELVSALCDPKPISTRPKTHQARSRYREEWPLSSLSDRELSVLSHVVAGRSNHETAEALGISRHTVRTHLQNIMAKMMVRSRTELISVVMRARIRIATDAVEQDG